MKKVLICIFGIVLACLIYNLDAITGQWKFEKLCKEQGGPRFFAPVEKDAGWEVNAGNLLTYEAPFEFGHIGFVRERSAGYERDARAEKTLGRRKLQFAFSDADSSKEVRYQLRLVQRLLHDDPRMGTTETQVVDLANGAIVASFTQFSYQWTKPERVLLAAPTAVSCWTDRPAIDSFYQSIYNLVSKK
jgi:hypothetical protein